MTHQGELLQILLNELAIGVSDLAKRTRMSRTAVYNWFTMISIPKETYEKISKAIGIDVEHEIRERIKKPKPKPYAVSGTQVAEPQAAYGLERIAIGVFLDGSEEMLNLSIKRLQAINASLKAI